MLLPGQGNGKAVRVCLQCFDTASKVKSAPRLLSDDNEQRNLADSSGNDSSGDDDDAANKEENHDEVCFIYFKLIKN